MKQEKGQVLEKIASTMNQTPSTVLSEDLFVKGGRRNPISEKQFRSGGDYFTGRQTGTARRVGIVDKKTDEGWAVQGKLEKGSKIRLFKSRDHS